MVGGAAMCLIHQPRQSTQDLDTAFEPVTAIRNAARQIAARSELSLSNCA